ncbi:Transport protein particle subunit trs23 [Verticillium dahliae VDG1]|nr:Transport protein particle subunit trs23 [Verticillium dahliae VDG1]
MGAEFTFQDVAEHNTKNDLYMVVHDKVYDCTKFVDEHPGGEEVMLDVGGQDATEAFEDVGHSDEARDTLAQLEVGTLKRLAGDPAPNKPAASTSSSSNNADTSGIGIGLYAVLLVGGAVAYGARTHDGAGPAEVERYVHPLRQRGPGLLSAVGRAQEVAAAAHVAADWEGCDLGVS